MLSFTEVTIGFILVALLIACLPTMYAAFSKHEMAVNLLAVYAGSPIEMLLRFHRSQGLDRLTDT